MPALLTFVVMTFARRSATVRSVVLAIAMLAASMIPSWSAAAAAHVHPLLPPHEPARNFRLASVHRVLASIDAARVTQEGLAPLHFDAARFNRLSVSEQVFVLSNLERTTRGLYPAMAMLTRLDAIAASAAARDQDPTDNGKGYSSIWSSAPSGLGQDAYFADFGWMYDDGPPPQYIFRNVDCARAGQSGCWGHRVNILSTPLHPGSSCRQELVTGTGFAAHTKYGSSLTQIFEVACAKPGLAVAFTWRDAVTFLKIPPSQSGL